MRYGTVCNLFDVVSVEAAASIYMFVSAEYTCRDVLLTSAIEHVVRLIKDDSEPDLTRVHEHRAFLCLRIGKHFLLDDGPGIRY